MRKTPPEQFEGFCVGFEVALCRDIPRRSQSDFEVFLDGAINYGLKGYDRNDLVILRDFLKQVLQSPNAADELRKLWKDMRPRYEFFSRPSAPDKQPPMAQVFTRVLQTIEKKLT